MPFAYASSGNPRRKSLSGKRAISGWKGARLLDIECQQFNALSSNVKKFSASERAAL
jgi:hypothetical protein